MGVVVGVGPDGFDLHVVPKRRRRRKGYAGDPQFGQHAGMETRFGSGFAHPGSKLTVEMLTEILTTTVPLRRLARKFGVSARTISMVRMGHSYREVEVVGCLERYRKGSPPKSRRPKPVYPQYHGRPVAEKEGL